jgi:hypothetical protein
MRTNIRWYLTVQMGTGFKTYFPLNNTEINSKKLKGIFFPAQVDHDLLIIYMTEIKFINQLQYVLLYAIFARLLCHFVYCTSVLAYCI